ncbi:MAG: hypothetical protein DRJ67_10025, partial [Thermoprotei archaeon]
MGWHLHRLLAEEEAERRYPDRVLIAKLLKLALSYRLYFIALAVATLARIGLNVLNPYVVKFVIDSVVSGNLSSLAYWSAVFLGLALASLIMGFVSSYSSSYLGNKVMYDLRNKMYRHIHRVKLQEVAGEPVGRIVSRITNDVDTIGNVATSGLLDTVGDVITIGGAMFMMWSLSPQLSLVCYMLIPLMVLVNVFVIS